MGFPTTESPINQIIDKLDSLPNSARDAAVNNSIVLSDNLGGFGESVLKLYSESSPSAREAIAEMFELVCNEPFDNWLDRVERSCDGFSKQKGSSRMHGMRRFNPIGLPRNRSTRCARSLPTPSMSLRPPVQMCSSMAM